MPHSPPATSTASGLEWVPSPPNVVSSCLLLSYVIKYVAVPSVSRTIARQVSITSVSIPEEKGGHILRCNLNPVYNPPTPLCLMILPSVLNVPLFW